MHRWKLQQYFSHAWEYILVNLFFDFAAQLYVPLLSVIFSQYFSDAWIGAFFAAFSFAMLLGSPVIGTISDHLGRTRIIKAGLFVVIIACLVYITTNNPILILLARFLDGLGVVAIGLISLSAIQDKIERSDRAKKTGMALSVIYVGRIVGPLIGGLLADYFFLKFPMVICVFVLFFLLVSFIDHNDMKKKKKLKLKYFNIVTEIKEFLRIGSLKGLAIVGFAMNSRWQAFMIFVPLFITRELTMDIAYVGLIFFIYNFVHLIQGKIGEIADKIGKRKSIIISCLFSAFVFLAIPFLKSYVLLVLFIFFDSIFSSLWNVSAWSFISNIGEDVKKEGQFMGVYLSMAKIGGLATSIAAGLVSVAFGIKYVFWVWGIILIIGILAGANLLLGKAQKTI